MTQTTALLVYNPKNRSRPVDIKVKTFEKVEQAFRNFTEDHPENLKKYWQGGDYCTVYHYSNEKKQDASINFSATRKNSRQRVLTETIVEITSSTITARTFKPTLLKILEESELKDLKVEVTE